MALSSFDQHSCFLCPSLMSSFHQATSIIDDFVHEIYPPFAENPVRAESNPPATNVPPLSPHSERQTLPLLSALGHASCSTIRAPIQMPLFDNSAMDGYAVRSWQTAKASSSNPLTFRVLGSIAAGDEPPVVLEGSDPDERTCWAIMTGAAFPLSVDQLGQPVDSSCVNRYDACVKLELVTANYTSNPTQPESITLTSAVALNANRRLAGEDIRVGDILVEQGEVLRKEHVMVLASMGLQELEVSNRPSPEPRKVGRRLRIGIINTGKEVVLNSHMGLHREPGKDSALPNGYKLDSSSSPFPPACSLPTPPSSRSPSISTLPLTTPQPALGASQIWNSNGPYIHASLLTWGFPSQDIDVLTVPLQPGQDGDDPTAFQAAVQAALAGHEPYDVLISTGGVSTGVHDYVPASIVALGGEIGFHKIKMRPGGPMMFAHLANGRTGCTGSGASRTAYFGLPGNPVAAAVCLRFIVAPALIGMRDGHGSMVPDEGRIVRMRGSDLRAPDQSVLVQRKPALTRMYVPARLRAAPCEHGLPEAEALARGSNMTKALTRSDGWVRFLEGEDKDTVCDGDHVELFGLDI